MIMTTITIKTGQGKPLESDLVVGELAIDTENLNLWSKNELSNQVELIKGETDFIQGSRDGGIAIWDNSSKSWNPTNAVEVSSTYVEIYEELYAPYFESSEISTDKLSPSSLGTIDLDGGRFTNAADPTGNQDLATKGYVDTLASQAIADGSFIGSFLNWDGNDWTQSANLTYSNGNLKNLSDPVEASDAATMNYVDTEVATFLSTANTYTDDEIATLTTYVDTQDAVTLSDAKDYTDQEIVTVNGRIDLEVSDLNDRIDEEVVNLTDYVDVHTEFTVVTTTSFTCEPNKNYVFTNVGVNNPTINLPTLGPDDDGSYVTIADGDGLWDQTGKHLTVNLNGTLLGMNIGQLVLDLPKTKVTFVWKGNDWSVYSTIFAHVAASPFTVNEEGVAVYSGPILVRDLAFEDRLAPNIEPVDSELDSPRVPTLKEELNIIELRSLQNTADIEELKNNQGSGGGTGDNHFDAANMEWWPTPLLEHEGTVSMQFNVADTGRPNVDMNLPEFALAQILDLNVSFFKGNNPNTGAQYDPKIILTQLDVRGEVIKTDMLVMNEEFGWGQGFERDEEQFQVQFVRGCGKVKIDIQNADNNAQPTKVNWQGRDIFNKIQINGIFITRDQEYEGSLRDE
jgi:hypothetical protein